MKKLISLIIVFIIILSSLSTAALAAEAGAKRFKDVPENAWYYAYVDRLTCEGTVEGVAADSYAPSKSLSRCEFVTMVIRSTVGQLPAASDLTHWAQPWMEKAYSLGIVTREEFPADTWDTPILRQDTAKVIARTIEIVRQEKPVQDTDEYISYIGDWESLNSVCKPFIVQAYAKGILTGIAGEFKGMQLTTRGEATAVIVRLIDPPYRAEWYDGVPFFPATDITATGTMAAPAAERFIMKTLENTRFYKENGKYYVSCEYPELPDGFEVFFSTTCEKSDSKVVLFSTTAFKETQILPKTGSFTKEILGISSLSDLKYVTLNISIDAPLASTNDYKKYVCTTNIIVDFSKGKMAEWTSNLNSIGGGHKELPLKYNDVFNW